MKTRFAPSPTGMMHIGGVRTALFAWLAAKVNNGTFLLRIEDTDRARFVEGSEEQIIESLKWLGIESQGEIVHQSERLDLYKEFAQKLIDKDLAYADPYTPEEVSAFREEAKQQNRPFLFRHHRPDNPPAWDGSQPLRFKVPEIKRYEWEDVVRGTLSAGEEALDDIVLLKSADEDGNNYPTYNFAHIVDDHDTGITHVIRGEEFIPSTPNYLALYEALEIDPPTFVTVPPILGKEGGKKLSKREGARSVLEYRDQGYLADAVVNFLAALGWNDGTDEEVFTMADLEEKFSLDRIQKSPARFDEQKLDWLNWQHIKRLAQENLDEFKSFSGIDSDDENLSKQIELSLTKASSLDELKEQLMIYGDEFNQININDFDLSKVAPGLEHAAAQKTVENVIEKLEATDFTSQEIESTLRQYVQDSGGDNRSVLNLIRWIISGQKVSPNLFEMLELVGKSESLSRLKASIN